MTSKTLSVTWNEAKLGVCCPSSSPHLNLRFSLTDKILLYVVDFVFIKGSGMFSQSFSLWLTATSSFSELLEFIPRIWTAILLWYLVLPFTTIHGALYYYVTLFSTNVSYLRMRSTNSNSSQSLFQTFHSAFSLPNVGVQ